MSYAQQASNAYKTSSYHGRSEAELMAALMSKIIKQIYQAQDAAAGRRYEEMHGINKKTLHILDVLREELRASDAMNDPEAAPAAEFLNQTYSDTMTRLSLVLSTPSPKDEFSALVELLTPVYRAWLNAAPSMTPPVPANVHVAPAPVAG